MFVCLFMFVCLLVCLLVYNYVCLFVYLFVCVYWQCMYSLATSVIVTTTARRMTPASLAASQIYTPASPGTVSSISRVPFGNTVLISRVSLLMGSPHLNQVMLGVGTPDAWQWRNMACPASCLSAPTRRCVKLGNTASENDQRMLTLIVVNDHSDHSDHIDHSDHSDPVLLSLTCSNVDSDGEPHSAVTCDIRGLTEIVTSVTLSHVSNEHSSIPKNSESI